MRRDADATLHREAHDARHEAHDVRRTCVATHEAYLFDAWDARPDAYLCVAMQRPTHEARCATHMTCVGRDAPLRPVRHEACFMLLHRASCVTTHASRPCVVRRASVRRCVVRCPVRRRVRASGDAPLCVVRRATLCVARYASCVVRRASPSMRRDRRGPVRRTSCVVRRVPSVGDASLASRQVRRASFLGGWMRRLRRLGRVYASS